MGYSTEYLGYLTVTPPLNPAEVEWVNGFADWGALPDGDPFHLPMNPRAALSQAFAAQGGVMAGRSTVPYGVRDWRASTDGSRIAWRRSEKSNDAVHTLRFLVEHYLGPGALAMTCEGDEFAGFTFDHRLDGVLAAARDDTDELFLIRVVASVIETQTLVGPHPSSWMLADC